MSPESDDFLPSPRIPQRVLRRRRRRATRRRVVGGLTLLVLVGGLALALGANSDDSPRRKGDARRSLGRTVPARRSANRTTTTSDRVAPSSSTPSEFSTSTTMPPPGPQSTSDPAPSPETDPVPADSSVASGVSVDAGSCRYDPGQQKLLASGTIHNSSGSEIDAEIEVTWSDASGDINTWSDLETVAAGTTIPWSIADDWFDAPQGAVRCQAASV